MRTPLSSEHDGSDPVSLRPHQHLLAPYLPSTDTSKGGMGSVDDAGCPGSTGSPRAWLCMDIWDPRLESSGDANPRSLLGLPDAALVGCGCLTEGPHRRSGSCLALVWLKMQLCLFLHVRWEQNEFCLKVSCLARPNFPGPLRENERPFGVACVACTWHF